MDVGAEFSSWNGFSQVLEKYSKANQVSYDVGLCSPVEKVNDYDDMPMKLPSKFKYCYAQMICTHGHHSENQKNLLGTSKEYTNHNCSSSILIGVNMRRTALVIKEAILDHSHHTPDNLFLTSRQLKEDERTMASVLLRAGVPLFRVEEFISNCGTRHEGVVKNSTKVQVKKDYQFLFCLDHLMTKDPNCVIKIFEFELVPSMIYIQTSEMMKRVQRMVNLDILSIQFITYKPSREGLSVISVVGVDEELNCHVLAVCISSLRKGSYFQKFVETFVKHNQDFCDSCKGIVLDCAQKESDFIQLFFPRAQVAWCRSSILDYFEKESKYSASSEQKSLSIFKEMMNSPSERDYANKLKTFLALFDSSTEFLSCWDSCKEMWVLYKIEAFDALKHQKSAVEMDFLNNLCGFITPDMNLLDIILALVERDRNEDIGKTVGDKLVEQLNINPCSIFYRSICVPEAAEIVICQIAIADSSCYNIKKQSEAVYVTRVDLERNYMLDVINNKCSCHFYKSTELPCEHIFAWLKFTDKDFCDENLIPAKWQVLGESVTLNSLAESIAQGNAPLSINQDKRLKDLQKVMREILSTCKCQSYEEMEKNLILLKQVLAVIKKDTTNITFKMDTKTEVSKESSLGMVITSGPKKRGRKSNKEKELLAAQHQAELQLQSDKSNGASHSVSNRRHNLRTNIKHKFVTRELSSQPKDEGVVADKSLTSVAKSATSSDVLPTSSEESRVGEGDTIKVHPASEVLMDTDRGTESENVKDAKDLKRNISQSSLLHGRYKIMKSMEESDYSDNETDDEQAGLAGGYEGGEEFMENDSKQSKSDEEWESFEARRARLEQGLSKFLGGISVESIQELMHDMSMLQHSVVRLQDRTANEEWFSPIEFVIKTCSEDQENLNFIVRSLEKQICDYSQFSYQLAACLILTAFTIGVDVSGIRESINEWPSHLPPFQNSLSPADLDPIEADQVLTVCGYKLHQADIATLNFDSELNSQVIHAYLEALAQRHIGKMFVIPFDVVHHWRNETYGEMFFKKVRFKTFDYLVLPIHCGAELITDGLSQSEDGETIKPQWMVLVANVHKKTVGVLIPRTDDKYAIAANGYMLQWRRYMQLRSILTGEMLSSWKHETLHCSKQTMDQTSGALLIMNVEAMISNVEPSVMTEAHIKRFLCYVRMTLRDTDRETTVLCVGGLECQQMAAQDSDWLQCENCRAWWHRACSGCEDGDSDSRTFYCSPCKQRIACVKSSGPERLI